MAMEDPIDVTSIGRIEEVGGKTLVCKMVGAFLKNGPKRLSAAQEGLKRGDLSAIEHAVHSLKSSAGNYGARALAELAEQIEIQAAQGQAGGLEAHLNRLEVLYKAVEKRLLSLLEEE